MLRDLDDDDLGLAAAETVKVVPQESHAAFKAAVLNWDWDLVRDEVRRGADVNAFDDWEDVFRDRVVNGTALHACLVLFKYKSDKAAAVCSLLDLGADPNLVCKETIRVDGGQCTRNLQPVHLSIIYHLDGESPAVLLAPVTDPPALSPDNPMVVKSRDLGSQSKGRFGYSSESRRARQGNWNYTLTYPTPLHLAVALARPEVLRAILHEYKKCSKPAHSSATLGEGSRCVKAGTLHSKLPDAPVVRLSGCTALELARRMDKEEKVTMLTQYRDVHRHEHDVLVKPAR